MMSFLEQLKDKLEGPVTELTAHFLLSICAIVFIALTELALRLLHLADKIIPLLDIPLSDWMFDMDIVAVSLILIVGCIMALKEMMS